MCIVSTPDVPEIPKIPAPPLPPKSAEGVEIQSPNPTRKTLSSRRKGKSNLTIPRNTSTNV